MDTNFINFSIKNKIDLVRGMTDCLLAKCIPVVLDSVMSELEKLGSRYRLALRLAKDPRFLRMPSYLERGTYADDDIVEHCRVHRCFIVATCDKDLRRRLRKIPGVPIMYRLRRGHEIVDGPRRRRGYDVAAAATTWDSPWGRVAAPPRLRRGIVRGDASRRRGESADLKRTKRKAAAQRRIHRAGTMDHGAGAAGTSRRENTSSRGCRRCKCIVRRRR